MYDLYYIFLLIVMLFFGTMIRQTYLTGYVTGVLVYTVHSIHTDKGAKISSLIRISPVVLIRLRCVDVRLSESKTWDRRTENIGHVHWWCCQAKDDTVCEILKYSTYFPLHMGVPQMSDFSFNTTCDFKYPTYPFTVLTSGTSILLHLVFYPLSRGWRC